MTVILWQMVGMGLLLGSMALGQRLWRNRLDHIPDRPERLAAILLTATLAGGFWGALAWWPNYPFAFAWPLPPFAAKMLAAAGWSFALASALALWRPFPAHLRMVLAMLWVYLAPLTLAILTLHLARFDAGQPVTWAFFAIVTLLLAVASHALWRLPVPPPPPVPKAPVSLWLIGLVAGIWGLALFFWPKGPSLVIWPWQGDPLTTRLIASMFLSVATAALLALRDSRLTDTALCTTFAYGAGVVLAGWVQSMASQPDPDRGYAGGAAPLSYLLVWGVLGLLAAASLVFRLRRP